MNYHLDILETICRLLDENGMALLRATGLL